MHEPGSVANNGCRRFSLLIEREWPGAIKKREPKWLPFLGEREQRFLLFPPRPNTTAITGIFFESRSPAKIKV